MNQDPPAIKVVDGEVHGFIEFEQWAMRHDQLWYNVINYGMGVGCNHPEAIKFIACEQTLQNRKLMAVLNRYVAEFGSDILNAANKT